MKQIIKDYKSGKLNNDIDESGAGGFWDLAGDLANFYRDKIMDNVEVQDL